MKQHNPGFIRAVEVAMQNVKEIDVEAVAERRKRGDTFLLIDVREDSEWNAGHAQGAMHIGKGVIERDIEKLVPDLGRELVLYCGGGYRSALAADAIQKMGYTNVRSMSGGWSAWLQHDLPTQKP